MQLLLLGRKPVMPRRLLECSYCNATCAMLQVTWHTEHSMLKEHAGTSCAEHVARALRQPSGDAHAAVHGSPPKGAGPLASLAYQGSDLEGLLALRLPMPPPATIPQDAGPPCRILLFFGVGPTLGVSGTKSPNARLRAIHLARA